MNTKSRMAILTVLVAVASSGIVRAEDESDGRALAERVRQALHANPYFYDEHVEVSVEDGRVVLRGVVLSSWDLLTAIRISNAAAEGHMVVDDLDLEIGGRK